MEKSIHSSLSDNSLRLWCDEIFIWKLRSIDIKSTNGLNLDLNAKLWCKIEKEIMCHSITLPWYSWTLCKVMF